MTKRPRRSVALDEHDRAILRLLQIDNKLPQREIAAQVHLSAASVQRRIADLEASGVIQHNVAVVDPKTMGQAVTVVVEVHLINDQTRVVSKVKAQFKNVPEIQQCYFVTGAAGMILIMLVEDMERYEAISRRLFADNELVSTYRSLVVLERVKVGLTTKI